MGKTITICFTNNKGGSGKSTTCSNLGAAMARAGKKVLLVDGDMQLNLSLSVFPEDWVLDGVEVFVKGGTNKKRIVPGIDAGAVEFSGSFQGHTLFRRADESSSAALGFEILTDTNNSTNDFYEREKQSLHE